MKKLFIVARPTLLTMPADALALVRTINNATHLNLAQQFTLPRK